MLPELSRPNYNLIPERTVLGQLFVAKKAAKGNFELSLITWNAKFQRPKMGYVEVGDINDGIDNDEKYIHPYLRLTSVEENRRFGRNMAQTPDNQRNNFSGIQQKPAYQIKSGRWPDRP